MNEEKIFHVLTNIAIVLIGIGSLFIAGMFLIHAFEIGFGAMQGVEYTGRSHPVAVMVTDTIGALTMAVVGVAAVLTLLDFR